MSKQANKTAIGAFVVGALTLVITGMLIFGSGKFFTKKVKYVLYFDESVGGLNVGAPVVFRGVKVGTVTDIQLFFNPDDLSIKIPVFIETEPERVKRVEGARYHPKYMQNLVVEQGLKGKLTSQSYVTGQLMIEFDFYPDKPIVLLNRDPKIKELPTIPSDMEEIGRTMENALEAIRKLPLEEIVNGMKNIIQSIDQLVGAPEAKKTIPNLNQTMKNVNKLVQNVDDKIKPLMSNIVSSSKAAERALIQIEKAFSTKEGFFSELETSFKQTSKTARVALKQIETTLSNLENRHHCVMNLIMS
jgi:paraquat-inducible protein B